MSAARTTTPAVRWQEPPAMTPWFPRPDQWTTNDWKACLAFACGFLRRNR